MAVLRTQLPTTFRINGMGKFAQDLRDKLETDFLRTFSEGAVKLQGEDLQPPRALEWYPNQLAWHLTFSRTQLRKSPALARIHELIKRENEAGSITRQEAVSMVPPLFLGVEPHHMVLDMCAAPGSKTAQMMEMQHVNTLMPQVLAAGIVVANDADGQRCNLLAHQTKRICSPALLVTNHDATQYPVRALPFVQGPLQFDRILCDVPCSGDGTLRKAPDIWRRWTPGNGNGLHPLQVRIALHACQMVKVGGRVVYSTCTFNPIEDEAVVAEVLRASKGAMQLLDMSSHLPSLKRLQGMKKWYGRDKLRYYASWAEAHGPHKLLESMFPDAASDALPLERCMRILPHHGDTGGFFIGVLEKVAEMPRDIPYSSAAICERQRCLCSQNCRCTASDSHASRCRLPCPAGDGMPVWGVRGGGGRGRQDRPGSGRHKGLDPVVPFTDEETLQSIQDFYGLLPEFPLWEQMIHRYSLSMEDGGKGPKRLYLVSAGVRRLLLNDVREALKVTMTGLKLFERQEVRVTSVRLQDEQMACRYRLVQDGVPAILPYITKQLLQPTVDEFLALVQERYMVLPWEPQKPRPEPQDPATLTQLKQLRLGCCVVMLNTRKAEDACAAHAPLAIAAWKGRGSLSVLVSKGMHLRSSMGYLLASGSGTLRSAQGCAISIQLHMALK
eukprot:jgi/Astpho2/9762/e_gw1.00149.36.1_t